MHSNLSPEVLSSTGSLTSGWEWSRGGEDIGENGHRAACSSSHWFLSDTEWTKLAEAKGNYFNVIINEISNGR